MTQQVIDIGSAPDDSTGDPLRLSFDKTNENFTELYAKGATEGLWNYNQTSSDTSTAPVSGRFKTNSGNYRDATQIAINAITIQGIDRSSTLRTLLVGDLIQCQDSTNTAAWCRYSLQSLPVDHGTWFQLNVTFQADGGVASGDNQEIVFVFTASSGGGGADLSGYAPLASPTFTGDPRAPTPTAGDNDTSVATTAFVQTALASVGGTVGPPQGRLTLQAGTPVMTTSQSVKTTVFYTPYLGNSVPIYNGTSFAMTTFAELSNITTNSSTGNAGPAAVAASSVYDLFVWNNSGTLTLTRGPVWTSLNVRSAGTALIQVGGIWLNNASITNGPAAQRGTYVGTIYVHVDAALYWLYPVPNGAGYFLVWNCYNRVAVAGMCQESAASWTSPAANTWRAFNGSAACRMHAVNGLAEDAVSVLASAMAFTPSSFGSINIGVNNSNTPAALMAGAHNDANGWHALISNLAHVPAIGFNFWQMLESSGDTATQFAGTYSAINSTSGMLWQARM